MARCDHIGRRTAHRNVNISADGFCRPHQIVEKPLVNIKNGVAGAKPPYRSSAICAVASCNGFVWLTASILAWSRGGSPSNIAPFLGKGAFGKDAEIRTHQALHDAKPSECPKGDRDNKSEVYFKNRLFLQTGAVGFCRPYFYTPKGIKQSLSAEITPYRV